MSAFEFILVVFAIIVGLSMSEVLAGWADQLKARDRLRPYPLQIVSSAFVLYLSIQYLWLLWLGRDIEWTFPRLLALACPGLVLALAARVSKADTTSNALSLREQYFQNSPAYTHCSQFSLSRLSLSRSFPDFARQFPILRTY